MTGFNQVCFVGLGYIGLPTASMVAHAGIKVLGVDINERVVRAVNNCETEIIEPDLDSLVRTVVRNNLLRAAAKPEISDAYFVVVPTPFGAGHEPDISYVKSATESIIPLLKEGDLYVIESTCPIGTTESMKTLIFDQRPELIDKIFIAYCPERVLPGNILFELANNERIIGGINEASSQKAIDFYSVFVKGKLHRTNSRTAEMCKLVENSFRDVQIAFANELSIICDKADINVWELISLANRHPRVHILNPGSGVGGHCIAVDPYFITTAFPKESRLIATAREVNNYKADWCLDKITLSIEDFISKNRRNPIVALFGLSFKANVDDLRESPAVHIVRSLINSQQTIKFIISEPNLKGHQEFQLTEMQYAYDKADIVVFLVNHDAFKNLVRSCKKVELDFCGLTNEY